MSIFDWLRGLQPGAATAPGDTETVRRIAAELDKLEPARARFLAAFAYVLSRVAGADSDFSEVETTRIVELLRETGRLPEAQAAMVVEIAKRQNSLFGGTENFLVTREFRELASDGQVRELLECLFVVAAADAAITTDEEAQIRQIASELGIPHPEYIEVRLKYSDRRTVLRKPT